MSVRHIYARPGEYIAVHRRHGGGGGSGGGDGAGCLGLLGIIFAIWLVVTFWKIIVGAAMAGAAGWLIWNFRRPIWNGVCRTAANLVCLIRAGYGRLRAYCRARKELSRRDAPRSGSLADYGQIRQHRR